MLVTYANKRLHYSYVKKELLNTFLKTILLISTESIICSFVMLIKRSIFLCWSKGFCISSTWLGVYITYCDLVFFFLRVYIVCSARFTSLFIFANPATYFDERFRYLRSTLLGFPRCR